MQPDKILNTKLEVETFNYYLPEKLIAQTPIEPRDQSRLMVLDRKNEIIIHRKFCDLPEFINQGDVLVFNDSKVISARLYGYLANNDRPVELLLLKQHEAGLWESLVKPGRRMREGAKFFVKNNKGKTLCGLVEAILSEGTRLIRFQSGFDPEEYGELPLPPYIKEPVEDTHRYQTIYSKHLGSVAAPTAGLHFTEGLLQEIKDKSAQIVYVTLHIGWDSFKPVKSKDFGDHVMHSEYWKISQDAANTINQAKKEGRRVISIGTTATRLLENAADKNPDFRLSQGEGWADIFITPGYQFKVVDSLVTNFHLPKSTLLLLTSALGGKDFIFRAYEEAVKCDYRFYSFGDGMVIL